MFLSKADRDEDGVGNSVDACPDVAPTGDQNAVRGCPAVVRQVTASYAAGVVSGTVTTVRPPGVPAEVCADPVTVEVRHAETGALLGSKPTDNGSYSVALGTQDKDGLTLKAQVSETNDQAQALCLMVDSEVVTVVRDADGDGWRDSTDDCPDVPPRPGGDDSYGCPILDRAITASYASGAVSGVVTFTGAFVPSRGVCGARADEDRAEGARPPREHRRGSRGKLFACRRQLPDHGRPSGGDRLRRLGPPRGGQERRRVLDGALGYADGAGRSWSAIPTATTSRTWMMSATRRLVRGLGMGVPTCRGRSPTSTYAGGILSGTLTVSPGSGGCAGGGQVWVTGGDLASAVSGTVEEGTGLFEVQVALDGHRDLQLQGLQVPRRGGGLVRRREVSGDRRGGHRRG